ncbi:DUF3427 domain-containing protein [Burkholderia contaminans]|uniref:DUF3427 domain-containing protein n=1 Tax=Burkholderia contaminans TaxID=488447 RepID=UPI001CF187AA|nr:DUF3427 domain-containing protein [Burkholderia contaminans]MCA7886371.1 DUF3427 domain-containing protein [Burkholderia contaminans]
MAKADRYYEITVATIFKSTACPYMPNLLLWNDYTREDVHAIFSPDTKFTPQAGTWGLQGMVRVPARRGDWVFFVTFGQEQGDHVFDESITKSGVLSWQSQPNQGLADEVIRELILHDERVNTIHLFLRTKRRAPYCHLGPISYITHDDQREKPVHFQWQLCEWPAPMEVLNRIDLIPTADSSRSTESALRLPAGITFVAPTLPKPRRQGVPSEDFRRRKSPDYSAQDARNRALGLQGELLVVEHEKATLMAAGRNDLASRVAHVSAVEGDGAGYDIRSFLPDGRDRYIEVKTTQGDAYTAFYISPNELAFSVKNPGSYVLYRLYQFDRNTQSAQAFVLEGDLTAQLSLIPMAYRAELQSGLTAREGHKTP